MKKRNSRKRWISRASRVMPSNTISVSVQGDEQSFSAVPSNTQSMSSRNLAATEYLPRMWMEKRYRRSEMRLSKGLKKDLSKYSRTLTSLAKDSMSLQLRLQSYLGPLNPLDFTCSKLADLCVLIRGRIEPRFLTMLETGPAMAFPTIYGNGLSKDDLLAMGKREMLESPLKSARNVSQRKNPDSPPAGTVVSCLWSSPGKLPNGKEISRKSISKRRVSRRGGSKGGHRPCKNSTKSGNHGA